MCAFGEAMSKQSTNIQHHLLMSYVFLSLVLLGYSSFALAEAADRDQPIALESDSVKGEEAKQISTY